MSLADTDRQTISLIVNQSQSPDEARQRFEKLAGMSLNKEYARGILEEAIRQKFLVIDSPAKAISASIRKLENELKD